MDVSRHIQQSHGQQIVWQVNFMLSLKYAMCGKVSTELRRHIVDSSHQFFGCTAAGFGYKRLFVVTVQSRYIHSVQLAESGCFGFRQIYMVRFVSSGMAYVGLMVSNGWTSSNDRCNLSNGNPIATTISPV